jgi:hypothetical protein
MQTQMKRPHTLEKGHAYLRLEATASTNGRPSQRVTFISYDPCPALVIVRDEDGRRWRCPRDQIFAPQALDHNRLFSAQTTAIVNAT